MNLMTLVSDALVHVQCLKLIMTPQQNHVKTVIKLVMSVLDLLTLNVKTQYVLMVI